MVAMVIFSLVTGVPIDSNHKGSAVKVTKIAKVAKNKDGKQVPTAGKSKHVVDAEEANDEDATLEMYVILNLIIGKDE
jgi:hypothetical protein